MFDGMGESALRNTQRNHLLTKVKRDGFIPKSEVRLAMSSDEEADINGVDPDDSDCNDAAFKEQPNF